MNVSIERYESNVDAFFFAQAKRNHEQAVVSHEENFIRFRSYGDTSKKPLVIVPGLDGATAFFADVIPELTLNVSVVDDS